MKKISPLLITLFFIQFATGQTSNGNINYGGEIRTYKIHIPPTYTPGTDVPLLVVLHGLGDSGNGIMLGTGFNQVADTAGFIAVYPDATTGILGTMWNAGADPTMQVDDVGMISALIDQIASQYSIDMERVYSTGFSMGGFMSHRLACDLGDKIAAIASVAGTIGKFFTCNPTHVVPVMHSHGTADGTVTYEEGLFNRSVEWTINFWRNKNGCPETPVSETLPDIASDGFTVDRDYYGPGTGNSEVILYTINGADPPQSWLRTPQNDMHMSREIWNFLKQYTAGEQILGVVDVQSPTLNVSVSPNPMSEFANITVENNGGESFDIRIFNVAGEIVFEQTNVIGNSLRFQKSDLPSGVYVVEVEVSDIVTHSQLSVQ